MQINSKDLEKLINDETAKSSNQTDIDEEVDLIKDARRKLTSVEFNYLEEDYLRHLLRLIETKSTRNTLKAVSNLLQKLEIIEVTK